MTDVEQKILEKLEKTNELLAELVKAQQNLFKLMVKYDNDYLAEIERSEGHISEG